MTSESINKTKRSIFRYVIGTTFLASIMMVYVFTQPSTTSTSIIKVARDGHGTAGGTSQMIIGKKTNLHASNLVPLQDVEEPHDDNFAMMLQKAATDDKVVIITEVNEAFAAPNSMLDLFLDSFRNGDDIAHLLNHLIIVAMDEKAFEKCNSVHHHCYLHKHLGSDLSSEKAYLSKDYLDLVWSKVRLWQFILEQGYSFLFTDADAMWFRNPFGHISMYADLTLATDVFYGNPEDHKNMPNTGLVFAKPTRKNIEMLKYWREARKRFPTTNEQSVYDKIKYELVSKFNLKVQYVSTAYWGNFCQPQMDFSKLSTFHACCRSGLAIKLAHIKSVIDEWKLYKSIHLKS